MSVKNAASKLYSEDLSLEERQVITEEWVSTWMGQGLQPRIRWFGALPFVEVYCPNTGRCFGGRWGVPLNEALIVERMTELAA